MSIQEQPRKPWPRWAICGPERARFDCWQDVPIGWELETPLDGLGKKHPPGGPVKVVAIPPTTPAAPSPDDPAPLSAMTVKQLRSWAALHGVDLGDVTKKADIVALIESAEAA